MVFTVAKVKFFIKLVVRLEIFSFVQKSFNQATNANTVNTFENIEKKFHNDPRKNLGDIYIYFRGDLLLLHCYNGDIGEISKTYFPREACFGDNSK